VRCVRWCAALRGMLLYRACCARSCCSVLPGRMTSPHACPRACWHEALLTPAVHACVQVLADVTRSLNLQFKAPGPLSRLSRLVTVK
jgi:hypothetical protein